MRGKPPTTIFYTAGGRNIPAYAGKTMVSPHRVARYAEHPRVCGENVMIAPAYMGWGGTSPRMRGKPIPSAVERVLARNIPAYAGKTFRGFLLHTLHKEHPRVCGENELADMLWRHPLGTSPRMRGKPGVCHENREHFTEHPRVCGENGIFHLSGRLTIGTSPRMRGKPEPYQRAAIIVRNIPAYAGKTVYC